MKTIQRIFKQIDQDGSGEIDLSEFEDIMKMMGSDLPPQKVRRIILRSQIALLQSIRLASPLRTDPTVLCSQVEQVFRAIDVDNGGSIDVTEFTEWWLAQESADTTVGQDGQVLTNKDDFDVQTLKQDLVRLDRTTAALQQQMNRVMQVLTVKVG